MRPHQSADQAHAQLHCLDFVLLGACARDLPELVCKCNYMDDGALVVTRAL